MGNAYSLLVGKLKSKGEDILYEDPDWICLYQDRVQSQALMPLSHKIGYYLL